MFIKKLIQSFDYDSISDFGQGLLPSSKYGATWLVAALGSLSAFIEKMLGISQSAFVALCVIMIFDLISGLMASQVRGDKLTSVRWSRFGLKLGLWFIVIYVTHMVSLDFQARGHENIALVLNWVHTAIILSIFFEYLLSVLENIGVIGNKDTQPLIQKIKEKIKNLF